MRIGELCAVAQMLADSRWAVCSGDARLCFCFALLCPACLPPLTQRGVLGSLGQPLLTNTQVRLLSLANTSCRLWEVNEVPAGTRLSTLPWANHKWCVFLSERWDSDMMQGKP